MSDNYKSKYDLRQAQIGGIVDTAESGRHQTINQHNYAPEQKQTLTEAAAEIQDLLNQLQQTQNITLEDAQNQVAKDIITKAENDPTFKGKLIQWGQSLGDITVKTALTEGVKGVISLALKAIA